MPAYRTRSCLTLVCLLVAVACPPQAVAQSPALYDPQIIERHLVEVRDGRRLNVECVGEGSPTIVFMQGGEGNIVNWRLIEKPIAAMTRVCFYDRAGFGYSDPPAGAVTALSETDDLHALLRAADIGGPVVLVGHSIGGFYATMYADRFPRDVAGLVLIDPGFAEQARAQTAAQLKINMANSRRGEERLLGCAALARQGRLSVEGASKCISFGAPQSPAEAAYFFHIQTHPYWYEAEVNQSRNYFWAADGGPSLDSKEEQAVRRSFGDMPVIVMSADRTPRDAWFGDAAFQDFVAQWRAGHDQLAARSTRGKSYVVPDSDHFIQLTQPAAVVAAIREVVDDARAANVVGGGR